MRRTSKEKQEVDLLSCSYLKVQRKSSDMQPNILSNQIENPVLESCNSTEDQQSQKLKVNKEATASNSDNYNQEIQKQKNVLGVILSSNSDIQGELNQDFLVETPTNCDRPVDEIEKQYKMESKKYYTMSCVKKKNKFQKKINKNKECNTDGQINNKILADQLQFKGSYLENYNIQQLKTSFDQQQSQINKSSFEEQEEEEEDQHDFSSSYCTSNSSQDAPYVSAFNIQFSPQKKRFLNLENSGNKYLGQYENEQRDSYLEDIEKQKQVNYEMLNEVYQQLEKEIEMEEQSQFNQQLEMNEFVQQMRKHFSMERNKQNGNNASSRSSCTSNYSQASSVHQIWDNSPLRQRGIDTESWVDLKSLDEGQFKKFTLFHLYKARCAQFDGQTIANSAVVDIMRRFIRNKRVQDISGYPWFSFDDKFDYVNIEEDLKKDPLCKVFLEYSKLYKNQREKKDKEINFSPQQQKANQEQTQQQNLMNKQFQESDIKSFQNQNSNEKSSIQQQQQQQRKQPKTELRDSLLNSSTNKKLKQIFITEMIQPNAPRNQYKALKEKEQNYQACEILQTEYSQNTNMKDTCDKVDLENIQAITQTSEENTNDKNNIIINGFQDQNMQQILSENKSPQFAQNFYPNFTMDGTLISNVVLNTQQNNQNCSSFIGAIYNNLNKCETTNSYIAENNILNHQQQLNQSQLELSPEQNELDYIQRRQRQILEKITSTPLRINQHLKSSKLGVNENNQTIKTIKKNNENLKQNGLEQFYNFNKKQSLSNKKERNLSSSSSFKNNKNKQMKKKEEPRAYSQMTPIKKNKNKEKNTQYDQNSTKSQKKKQTISSSLNGHLIKNERTSHSKISTQQENYYDHKSNISKKQQSNSSMANDLSFSKNHYFTRNSADSISISKQRSVSQQQSNTKNKNLYGNKQHENFRNSKTPNKKDLESSYTLAKKDFTSYFKKDYAKYYSRRRFVSSSCEKMLRLNTNQAQNCSTVKKKQQNQSPQIKMQKQQSCSTQKISKQYNILNSILQNQKINENERSKLLSNYFSNHLRLSADDSRQKFENFPKNIVTSEFNIDGYLNQNLDQEIIDSNFTQYKPNNNFQSFGSKINSRVQQNYSQRNQNLQTEKSFENQENILTEKNRTQNAHESRKSQHQLSFIIQQLNKNQQQMLDQTFLNKQNVTKGSTMQSKDQYEQILQKSNINNNCYSNHLSVNSNNQKNKLLVYKSLKNKQILKPYQQNLQYI
ncbi:hypothetical protein TTHERM_00992680 (macronuclear) [Tetrahymena thermophila SB210]|uniref:Uncharacterized protein n=1 Tax=Tetrahymena thermophila (strain SB210) TaxID=312017 RepID=Q22DD4_TETTS|nr:hypothetical protein TTHERM_00992680 [Tetrahymena thermophila SB210]EAR83268.1 hypothetical protein TTHERM_00992680 [Tetrahymena thermophila SB210]|eukprot:XP_001030931.1 hypothetical protein TTHERM_00992680 [Tetrahymena thermophila SB210]